jgi:hypothetical protein
MRQQYSVYRLLAIALLAILPILSTLAASAQSVMQTERHWISLGPNLSTATAGATVTYSVSVGTSSDYFPGDVLIMVPSGLTVIGQPMCSIGCRLPSVLQSSTGSQIQTPVSARSGESASFSFDVQVAPTTPAGTSFQLTAFLLGGVNTAGGSETAFASLTVNTASESSVPAGVPSTGAAEDITFDDIDAPLSPGDTFRIRVNLPLGGSVSDYLLTIFIPIGLDVVSGPVCFGSTIDTCTQNIFEKTVIGLPDGTTEIKVWGANDWTGPTSFVISVRAASVSVSHRYEVVGVLESVRSWGTEPIAEVSKFILIGAD